jgi:hypothetical protein
MVRNWIVATCLGFLAGCGSTPTSPSEAVADVTTAPTHVAAGGQTITLTASIWRDFMPPTPPDGRPLIAVLQVKTESGAAVPAGVIADKAWIISGQDIWSTLVNERPRAETAPFYEVVVRDGPKWGPGIAVDVVVRLTETSGRAFLLRAPNQVIYRSE